MEELTIGQVAHRAGVRASTLRYYESIGLLPCPRRVNGRRHYDPGIVQLVRVINLAKQAGFTISEIQTLLHGFEPNTPPAARWRTLASEKIVVLDQMINRIQQMKHILVTGLQCGCLRFEECVIVNDRCRKQ